MTGPQALTALQWLCTADVDVPPGRTVYTGMLNARGRYEADITVTRLAADEFLIFSSAASTERDLDHIRGGGYPAVGRGDAGGRDLGVRGLRGDGPALAGAAVAG